MIRALYRSRRAWSEATPGRLRCVRRMTPPAADKTMLHAAIPGPHGEIPVHIARPAADAPWPGVVVIHDALGMTSDLRHQAD